MKKVLGRMLNSLGYSLVRTDAVPGDIDEGIRDIISRVRPYTMTSPERLNALCMAGGYIARHRISGDIVECGVWRGGSMLALSHVLVQHGDTARTIWMFDTFEGMPVPSEHDLDASGTPAQRLLQKEKKSEKSDIWCCASLKDVQENMKGSGYPLDRIRFVKGKVEETLASQPIDKIALLRLDTDWYESTKIEMEMLFPRLVKGGVLIIDDYGHWQGARKAIDEYLNAHNLRILLNRIDYTGRIAVKL